MNFLTTIIWFAIEALNILFLNYLNNSSRVDKIRPWEG